MNKADLKKVELVCAEVDDLRGEYFDGLGVIQIHAKLSVGDTSVEVIFQNQGDGEMCLGHEAELGCQETYRELALAIGLTDEDHGECERWDWLLIDSGMIDEATAKIQAEFDKYIAAEDP